jgi:predicted metalloendopeptidase
MKGKPAPVCEGFTGDQRFVIAFGQSWRAKIREAALRTRIATDGHAPSRYRAATVRNIDAWYAAFSVTPKQKMYLAPKDPVRNW